MPDALQDEKAAPGRWSFGLDGGGRLAGNLSAMGVVVVMLFMLRMDMKDAADAYRQDSFQAHKEAQLRSEKFSLGIGELTAETRASRMELQSIRASNERTERVLSGAETPWWASPRTTVPVPKADPKQ